RRVESLRGFVAATAREQLEALDRPGELDLLPSFAHTVPSLVISELLGVPVADREQLTAWSDAVTPLLHVDVSDEDRVPALAAAESFAAYVRGLLEQRARAPDAGLLSALLAAEADGARLTRLELLSLAMTLYSAGHRTTRDLFANGLSTLLGDV